VSTRKRGRVTEGHGIITINCRGKAEEKLLKREDWGTYGIWLRVDKHKAQGKH